MTLARLWGGSSKAFPLEGKRFTLAKMQSYANLSKNNELRDELFWHVICLQLWHHSGWGVAVVL